MILVVGATSQPGQKLVPLLLGKGYQVRALTRDPQKAAALSALGAEGMVGDIHNPDSLQRACAGAAAVVSSVTAPWSMPGNNIRIVDKAGNRLLMKNAKAAGVQHFVFVSAYSAASNHPADLLRVKYQTEIDLKNLGLDYTILRPTAFMDSWCARIGMQVANGQAVTIWGNGKNPINFISAEDVAMFIVFAFEDPRLRNQTLTIGGPQNLTFNEVAAIYERLLSKKVPRQYNPAFRMKLMSFLYAPFNETQARFMAMRHELATANWQVEMNELIKHYPINLTSLEQFIAKGMKQ